MKRATKFGQALRRIRFERNESMKDMANKLGISIAFLSAVELGNKKPPSNLIERLVNSYNLNDVDRSQLENLQSISYDSIQIKVPIAEFSPHQQDLAVGFARSNPNPRLADFRKFIEDLENLE